MLLEECHCFHLDRPAPRSHGRPRRRTRASGAAPGGGGSVRDSQSLSPQSPTRTITRSQSPVYWSPVPAATNHHSYKYILHSDTHRLVYHSLPRTDTRHSVHLPVYTWFSALLRSSCNTPSKNPLFLVPALHRPRKDTHISWQLRPIELFLSPRYSPAILSSRSAFDLSIKSSCYFTHLWFPTLFVTPVHFRNYFKVLVLVSKSLKGLAPSSLSDWIQLYDPSRALRSADRLLLAVPHSRLQSRGDRAFAVTAPKLWNNLPPYVRQAQTLAVFKCSLKTYFYSLAFNSVWELFCVSGQCYYLLLFFCYSVHLFYIYYACTALWWTIVVFKKCSIMKLWFDLIWSLHLGSVIKEVFSTTAPERLLTGCFGTILGNASGLLSALQIS